jgi:hypothetical protein
MIEEKTFLNQQNQKQEKNKIGQKKRPNKN